MKMSRNSMAVLSAVLVLVTLQCGDILHSTAYLESFVSSSRWNQNQNQNQQHHPVVATSILSEDASSADASTTRGSIDSSFQFVQAKLLDEPSPPTSICFVTCNYADDLSHADKTPAAVLRDQPGVHHFLVTNNLDLAVSLSTTNSSSTSTSTSTYNSNLSAGWIPIIVTNNSTNTDSSFDLEPRMSMITQSRYAKFLGWQLPEIQRYCRAVFYMDATYQTVANVGVYHQLADRLLRVPIQIPSSASSSSSKKSTSSKETTTTTGWMQYPHSKRTGGPLDELEAIQKARKDTPEHVQQTVEWLQTNVVVGLNGTSSSSSSIGSSSTATTTTTSTMILSNMTVYLNTFLAYDPQNPAFQQLTLDFWKEYSQETTSWRDQPLWAYFVWKHSIKPLRFPKGKGYYFRDTKSARGFGGHKYHSSNNNNSNNSRSNSTTSTGRTTTTTTTIDTAIDHPTNDTITIDRELTFLHIPKTGGSSVISASILSNNDTNEDLTWGDCLFFDKSSTFTCSQQSRATRPCLGQKWTACAKHWPMQFLHAEEGYCTGQDGVVEATAHHPYHGKDVFVIIRNPYSWILSEYYYYCSQSKDKRCPNDQIDNVTLMNVYLQNRLRKRKQCPVGDPKCYFDHCGHGISQYDFVFDTRQTPPQRLVKWVLHNEQLDDEFPVLMQRYGLNVTLPTHRINQAETGQHRLTVTNFTAETRALIQEVYHHDFEAFGYKK